MTDQSLLLDIGGIWAVIFEIVETLRVFDRCFERVFFRAIVSIIIHIVIAVFSIFTLLRINHNGTYIWGDWMTSQCVLGSSIAWPSQLKPEVVFDSLVRVVDVSQIVVETLIRQEWVMQVLILYELLIVVFGVSFDNLSLFRFLKSLKLCCILLHLINNSIDLFCQWLHHFSKHLVVLFNLAINLWYAFFLLIYNILVEKRAQFATT